MTIIETNKELSPVELYKLTMSPEVQKMTGMKGQTLHLLNWCIYEDVNSDGVPVKLLSIETDEGKLYATNSATFLTDFGRMVDLFCKQFGGTIPAIKVLSGTSKAGREYITCAYAE